MSEATPLLELVILHITRFRVEIHRKKASINLKCFATQTFEFISFALFDEVNNFQVVPICSVFGTVFVFAVV